MIKGTGRTTNLGPAGFKWQGNKTKTRMIMPIWNAS